MPNILLFVKPDAVLRKKVGAELFRQLLSLPYLTFRSLQRVHASGDLLLTHYAHVTKRGFFPWLVDYITIGDVLACIVEIEDDGVDRLRDHLGSTICQDASAGSLRNLLGIYGGINCLHASDSIQSGAGEVAAWKEIAGLRVGQFDTSPVTLVEHGEAYPLHTPRLREICAAIATQRQATPAQVGEVVELLFQECPNAPVAHVYRLAEVAIGSALR